MERMLVRLLKKGIAVSIESGQLVIRPASDRPVTSEWMEKNSKDLILDILSSMGIEAYQYYEYSTGYYDNSVRPGITLQFRSVAARGYAHAIFNVELTRERDTKAGRRGGPLPKGQFRIKSERCGFYKFWTGSGVRLPRRNASFHDYMGRLKKILFTAEFSRKNPERMSAKTLRPLSISAEAVREATFPDSRQTKSGRLTDNSRTILPDKEFNQDLESRGSQAKVTTCASKYGKAVNSDVDVVRQSTLSPKRPEEQSVDEWTECLCRPV